MTLCDTEMTLRSIFCQSPYQKCYVTVIIDYFNVSCCVCCALRNKELLHTVAKLESEKIDIVTFK